MGYGIVLRDSDDPHLTAAGKAAADFDGQFPPGYFGHRALLGPTGRYGSWLLALPVAISIDDTLFMHGGPSHIETFDPKPLLNKLDGKPVPESFGDVQLQFSKFREQPILGSLRSFKRYGMAAKVLIVDDDSHCLAMVALFVARLGYDVIEFTVRLPFLGEEGNLRQRQVEPKIELAKNRSDFVPTSDGTP